MSSNITIFFANTLNLINKSRSLASLLIVFFVTIISDSLFHQLYPQVILLLEQFFDISEEAHVAVDLTFAPEIWGGVLATVLGTLIIVIAIAAESTPKLMDLFVRDWISLIFIWFLILASIHSTILLIHLRLRSNVVPLPSNILCCRQLGHCKLQLSSMAKRMLNSFCSRGM